MEKEDIKILASVHGLILKKPELSSEIIDAVKDALKQYRIDIDKKAANIWLIVKNLKQKDLERLKEMIVPDVFESLGL